MSARLIVVEDPRAFCEANAVVVPVSSRIRRKRELFGVMKKHLRLPGCFANNWDAWNDALRDLSWLTDVKHVVLRHDGLPFPAESPHRATYLELLQSLLDEAPSANPAVTIVLPTAEQSAIRALNHSR